MSDMITEFLDDYKRAESSFIFSNVVQIDRQGNIYLVCDYFPGEKVFLDLTNQKDKSFLNSNIGQSSSSKESKTDKTKDEGLNIEVLKFSDNELVEHDDNKNFNINIVVVENPNEGTTPD